MRKWNKEQHEAINDRGRNLLVSAGAGSGKTAVLVERIIRIICEDRVGLDRLLVVTFTQAAAAEMRERISDALLDRISDNSENEEHLRRQLHLLGSASISTIHAFCSDVLRRYFHVIEIDPHFRVADENEAGLLKIDVLEALLETEYEKSDPLFLALVEMFSSNRNDQGLAETITRLHNFIHSLPRPWAWLEEQVRMFGLDYEEFLKCSWLQEFKEKVNEPLDAMRTLFLSALRRAERAPALDAYKNTLLMDLANLDLLDEAIGTDLPTFFQVLREISIPRLGRAGKDADSSLKEQVKELRSQAKAYLTKMIKTAQSNSIEGWHSDLLKLHPYMKYLQAMVLSFSASYAVNKRDKNLLDFNDLEHFCLKILQNPVVAAELREKYRCIFVDEYQDSNLVQEEIIQTICDERNLFLVGDVKQSIYRFRLADPTLFLKKYREYDQENSCESHHRIDLMTNYRSLPAILNAVNTVFGCIMSEALGEMDYTEEVFLYPGSDCYVGDSASKQAVEVLIMEKQMQIEPDNEFDEIENAEIEARIVAGRIQELIGQPFYDSRTGSFKALEYRDIVILLRATRQWGPIMWQTLTEQGIPTYADMNTGYFEAVEVQVLLNLLRLIDNRRQDIPLLGTMRSSIGGFSMEEMAQIKAAAPGLPFHEAVVLFARENDELGQKLTEFLEKLEQWQEKANYLAVDELIWDLIHETSYYYYLGALPGGEQRQGNIRLLIDRAHQFQQTSFSGLFHFLGYLEQIEQGSGDLGVARLLGENENLIRIMSIHKSKGLEFPLVIIPGLGKKFNWQESAAPLILNRGLGLGPRFVDLEQRTCRDTLARQIIKARIRRESLAEEMRILYVAMTRARNRLILLGSRNDIPRCAAKWIRPMDAFTLSQGGCFLDWIGPVLLRHQDGEALRRLLPDQCIEEDYLPDKSKWEIRLVDSSDIISKCSSRLTDQGAEQHASTPQQFEREIIYERLNWVYPYKQAQHVPSKIAASQLWRINQTANSGSFLEPDLPSLRKIPLFLKETEPMTPFLTAALKGTLTHLVMQHLDLKQVAAGVTIEELIGGMVSCELLSAEEASFVDAAKIRGFFTSELGRRVLKSPLVFRELPFNLKQQARQVLKNCEGCEDSLLLQGVVDLCFLEDEELVLLDYKTDNIFSGEDLTKAVEKYRPQLALYRTALELLLQRQVKSSYLYFLTPGYWVEL